MNIICCTYGCMYAFVLSTLFKILFSFHVHFEPFNAHAIGFKTQDDGTLAIATPEIHKQYNAMHDINPNLSLAYACFVFILFFHFFAFAMTVTSLSECSVSSYLMRFLSYRCMCMVVIFGFIALFHNVWFVPYTWTSTRCLEDSTDPIAFFVLKFFVF